MDEMQKKPQSDPFDSWGASKVFYQLVCGHTTPKEISSNLKIEPPTVVEHLRRLQDIGIVEIGKKEGKYQHYRISWDKFGSVFLEHMPSLVNARTFLEAVTPDILKKDGFTERDIKKIKKQDELELRSLERLFSELEKNEYFRRLVKEYLKSLAHNIVELGIYELTLNEAAGKFEGSVRSMPFKKRTKNPEPSRFLNLLKKWGAYSREIDWFSPERAFEEAIEVSLGSVVHG